jgi:hypothetical protein
MNITNECKKTAAIILKGCGIGFDKLTAKSVGFSDLARADCVFVKAHGLRVNGGAWQLAQAVAREHGFRIIE